MATEQGWLVPINYSNEEIHEGQILESGVEIATNKINEAIKRGNLDDLKRLLTLVNERHAMLEAMLYYHEAPKGIPNPFVQDHYVQRGKDIAGKLQKKVELDAQGPHLDKEQITYQLGQTIRWQGALQAKIASLENGVSH